MTEVWCKFCYARENEIQIRLYSPPPQKKNQQNIPAGSGAETFLG